MIDDILTLIGWVVTAVLVVAGAAAIAAGSYWLTSQALQAAGI